MHNIHRHTYRYSWSKLLNRNFVNVFFSLYIRILYQPLLHFLTDNLIIRTFKKERFLKVNSGNIFRKR